MNQETLSEEAGALVPVAPGSASGRVEHFRFNLEDKVIIREIQRPGVVEALTVDFLGPQYRVVYWDNSERKTAWLKVDELERRGGC